MMFPTIPPEVLLAIWLPLAGCVMALCLYDEEEDDRWHSVGRSRSYFCWK